MMSCLIQQVNGAPKPPAPAFVGQKPEELQDVLPLPLLALQLHIVNASVFLDHKVVVPEQGQQFLKPSCKIRAKNIMQKMQRHANASCATPAAPTGDWQDGLCHRWDQNISARMFFDGHSQTVHFMPCRIAFYLGKSRLITWKTWRHFRSTTGSSCQRLWNHAMYSALAWRHQTGTAQMPESFLTLLRR